MESMTFDFGRDPDANAMYLLTLDRLRVLHMGDIGNPLAQEHLNALRGNVEVLFALAGAHATISLEDLDAAIEAIGPRVVIPMHSRCTITARAACSTSSRSTPSSNAIRPIP
jgi:L-ascorbate metabolism protein UlaG (beta-lactamase superfamily)